MKIKLFIGLFLFFIVLPFLTVGFAQKSVMRVDVEQVKVNIVVEDLKGNLVGGLVRENFKVYEDKKQQEINYFSFADDNNVTVVLLVEFSKAIPWSLLYEAWYGSYVFLDKMKKDDWIAIVAYDIKPEILADFTQSKDEAKRALARLNQPGFRESNLYDAMYDVLDRLDAIEGRTAVVLVSSGIDTFSKINMGEIFDKTKNTDSTIYALSIGGNLRVKYDQYFTDNTRMDLYRADAVLKEFAKNTGGEAFFPRFIQAFGNIFENISLSLRNQYSIGYIPDLDNGSGKDKFKKIKVEVSADINGDGKPDKLKAIHRQGYYR